MDIDQLSIHDWSRIEFDAGVNNNKRVNVHCTMFINNNETSPVLLDLSGVICQIIP